MYMLTKSYCNRSVAVRNKLIVDPWCKGISLFIDPFLGMRGMILGSHGIWRTLLYGDFSVLTTILSRILFYVVSSFGEGLCNVAYLCKINIWCDEYGSILAYCYRFVMMLRLCFVTMTWYKCDSFSSFYINAICWFWVDAIYVSIIVWCTMMFHE